MRYYKHPKCTEYYRVYDDNTYEYFHTLDDIPRDDNFIRKYSGKWLKPAHKSKFTAAKRQWKLIEISEDELTKSLFIHML